jgi:hypothetical protein
MLFVQWIVLRHLSMSRCNICRACQKILFDGD